MPKDLAALLTHPSEPLLQGAAVARAQKFRGDDEVDVVGIR